MTEQAKKDKEERRDSTRHFSADVRLPKKIVKNVENQGGDTSERGMPKVIENLRSLGINVDKHAEEGQKKSQGSTSDKEED